MARTLLKFRRNHYVVTAPGFTFYPRSIRRARQLVEQLMHSENGSLIVCKLVKKHRKLNWVSARTVFTNNFHSPHNQLKAKVKFDEFSTSHP